MAKTLEIRGRFDAHYADFAAGGHHGSPDGPADEPTELGVDGVWGDARIDLSSGGINSPRTIGWAGRDNWPSTNDITLYWNILPKWTGNPAVHQALLDAKSGGNLRSSAAFAYISTSSQFVSTIYKNNNTGATVLFISGLSFTANVPTQIQFSYEGSTGAFVLRQDGNVIVSGNNGSLTDRDNKNVASIGTGSINPNILASAYDLYHFEIYDSIEGDLTTRTDYDATPIKQPEVCSDPGIANVKDGVTYDFQGNSLTGALSGSTDPGETNVRNGVTYNIDGVDKTGSLDLPSESDVKIDVQYDSSTKTGTYDGSDRWSDPGETNVAQGIQYKANSETNNKTGTLVVSSTTNVAPVTGKVGNQTVKGTV